MTESAPSFKTEAELRAYMAKHFPHMLNPVTSKFSPKLSFAERCEILALIKAKMDRRVIALAYGVARSTVAFIDAPASAHYRDVRKEYNDYGHERFLVKYLTPAVMERYSLSAGKAEAMLSDDELRDAKEHGDAPGQHGKPANPKATKAEGPFRCHDPLMASEPPQKYTMVWSGNPGLDPMELNAGKEVQREPGWYAEGFGNLWGSNDDRHTSLKARDAFLKASGLELME